MQLRDVLLSCTDIHAAEYLQWVLKGGGYRITKPSWTREALTGRFQWDYDHTTFWSGSSVSSHHTGGMATEFDRRIGLMLEQEKFTLLTSSVTDVTRQQYMKCWQRWARFCACMDVSPWLTPGAAGWDNILIDFLVWEYKLLGIQHSTLAKRFFAIRFVHIAEGHDDLSLRAHRVRMVLKAIKLRSKTCKKVPFNTDLLRWLHKHLEISGAGKSSLHIVSVWTGMLLALFFCFRISELLNLTPADIKFRDDAEGLILSAIIRGSKTDQEKRGVTRSLRATSDVLCPVMAMRQLANWFDPRKHPAHKPFFPTTFRKKW